MRPHLLLLVGIGLMAFPACNVTRTLEKRNTKAFQKNGLEQHTFDDGRGARFTWASPGVKDGTRPGLLLVHGITSSNAMWAGNLPTLGKDFDLIVPDLVGHGRSTSQWSGNSVDEQVAHLAAILDGLGVKGPVFVVGNSYGGAIAANFAEQHPERVRGLVIYDGPASDYTAAIADSVARSVGAADITELFTPKDADEQYRLLSMALYEAPKVPRFALRQMHKRLAAQRTGHLALLRDLLEREDQYATKRYQWTMPVHVIWGEGDQLIPPNTGKGIVRRNELGEDRLIMVPKAGHVANIEQREVFEGHLKRILVDGPCPDPARVKPGPCTKEYMPVCGCDGRSYGNLCEAWRAGVSITARKACGDPPPGPCPDQALKARHQDDLCTMDHNSVCGCDGKTYSNACHAQREGVRVVGEGECR